MGLIYGMLYAALRENRRRAVGCLGVGEFLQLERWLWERV